MSEIGLDGTPAALEAVRSERMRQVDKWGTQRHDFTVWSAVLSEEVGEFAQAVLEGRGAAHRRSGDYTGPQSLGWLQRQRNEAVQCAAVAVSIVEHLDELIAAHHYD